ncbi:uncharacterized protein V6R79_010423 [Siganus canaliculatus]
MTATFTETNRRRRCFWNKRLRVNMLLFPSAALTLDTFSWHCSAAWPCTTCTSVAVHQRGRAPRAPAWPCTSVAVHHVHQRGRAPAWPCTSSVAVHHVHQPSRAPAWPCTSVAVHHHRFSLTESR